MSVSMEHLKCIACMACEMACGYHRDEGFAFLSSSIQVYRAKEKKDYFGLILKGDEDLILGRPEGVEVKKIGAVDDESSSSQEDASAKPMLLREGCDICDGVDMGPMCINFCPTGALSLS